MWCRQPLDCVPVPMSLSSMIDSAAASPTPSAGTCAEPCLPVMFQFCKKLASNTRFLGKITARSSRLQAPSVCGKMDDIWMALATLADTSACWCPYPLWSNADVQSFPCRTVRIDSQIDLSNMSVPRACVFMRTCCLENRFRSVLLYLRKTCVSHGCSNHVIPAGTKHKYICPFRASERTT